MELKHAPHIHILCAESGAFTRDIVKWGLGVQTTWFQLFSGDDVTLFLRFHRFQQSVTLKVTCIFSQPCWPNLATASLTSWYSQYCQPLVAYETNLRRPWPKIIKQTNEHLKNHTDMYMQSRLLKTTTWHQMRFKATPHTNQANATWAYVADTRFNLAQVIWSDKRGKEVMA